MPRRRIRLNRLLYPRRPSQSFLIHSYRSRKNRRWSKRFLQEAHQQPGGAYRPGTRVRMQTEAWELKDRGPKVFPGLFHGLISVQQRFLLYENEDTLILFGRLISRSRRARLKVTPQQIHYAGIDIRLNRYDACDAHTWRASAWFIIGHSWVSLHGVGGNRPKGHVCEMQAMKRLGIVTQL